MQPHVDAMVRAVRGNVGWHWRGEIGTEMGLYLAAVRHARGVATAPAKFPIRSSRSRTGAARIASERRFVAPGASPSVTRQAVGWAAAGVVGGFYISPYGRVSGTVRWCPVGAEQQRSVAESSH